MSSVGFFNRGLIIDDFRVEGKVPVRRDRLTIDKMVGDIASAMCLRTIVGIGSRSQNEFGDLEIRLCISGMVAGVKVESGGGGVEGGKWTGVEEGLLCKLRWSFDVLSEK